MNPRPQLALSARFYLPQGQSQRKRTLQRQVSELQKSEEQNYIIRGKLAEKEKEIEEIKAQMTILQANMGNLLKLFIEHGYYIDVEEKNSELILYTYDKELGPVETAKMPKKQLEKEKIQQT